jgi:2,4'-dihydroxyacetophenone dioxygenase
MVMTVQPEVKSERFADGSSIVRVEQLRWVAWAVPGVAFKLLSINRGAGIWSALMRVDPGTKLPVQRRLADAYVSIVRGSALNGGKTLSLGNFHVEHGGGSYGLEAGAEGLELYVIAFGGSMIADDGHRTLVDLDWLYDAAAQAGDAGHLPGKVKRTR